jgi:hypothetical protein
MFGHSKSKRDNERFDIIWYAAIGNPLLTNFAPSNGDLWLAPDELHLLTQDMCSHVPM